MSTLKGIPGGKTHHSGGIHLGSPPGVSPHSSPHSASSNLSQLSVVPAISSREATSFDLPVQFWGDDLGVQLQFSDGSEKVLILICSRFLKENYDKNTVC